MSVSTAGRNARLLLSVALATHHVTKSVRLRCPQHHEGALPPAIKHVPCAGELPSLPSALMNFSFHATNAMASAFGAKLSHHGANFRSGVSAMPLPCSKNFCSHGTIALRPPKGGFIHTKPKSVQSSVLNETVGRNPRRYSLARARDIGVELAAERIEHARWRVPLVYCADTLLVKCHSVDNH